MSYLFPSCLYAECSVQIAVDLDASLLHESKTGICAAGLCMRRASRKKGIDQQPPPSDLPCCPVRTTSIDVLQAVLSSFLHAPAWNVILLGRLTQQREALQDQLSGRAPLPLCFPVTRMIVDMFDRSSSMLSAQEQLAFQAAETMFNSKQVKNYARCQLV